MRSGPTISVRAQLSLSFLAVILMSWAFSTCGLIYVRWVVHRDMERQFRAAMAMNPGRPPFDDQGRLPPPPPPEGEGPPFALFARGLPIDWRGGLFPAHIVMALVLSVAAGAWLSRRFTRPLASLSAGARAFQGGHLEHRIPEGRQGEFASVAQTMNDMASRLADQIATLEEDARRQQQVLADMAHELRSPVATLRTMAEALRDGLADEPLRRQRALQATVSSIERLEKLVDDVMVLARLDLHQLPLDSAPVDVRALARTCVETHRGPAEKAGVSLTPVREGEPVIADADGVRLAQVLDNLLDNAVSYAGAGARASVTVEAGPVCTIVVEDTGRGVAEAHLPFLFDPFYRVDASRSPGDRHAGLGLRISRGLVEAHGGTLDLHSEEGRGTTVTIKLPGAEHKE